MDAGSDAQRGRQCINRSKGTGEHKAEDVSSSKESVLSS